MLVEVARRPGRLHRVTFDATLVLSRSSERARGKKTDHFYSITPDGDALAELREALETAAAEEGVDLALPLSAEQARTT